MQDGFNFLSSDDETSHVYSFPDNFDFNAFQMSPQEPSQKAFQMPAPRPLTPAPQQQTTIPNQVLQQWPKQTHPSTIPKATHGYVGTPYKYPKMPENFLQSTPPFPPPFPNYNFDAFKDPTQLEEFIKRTPNLNDSYIAIPLPFWTRYREPNHRGRPTFGYFIHQ